MNEKIIKIDISKYNLGTEILAIFNAFNNESPDSIRLVGGCVRDMILGYEVSDFDFATKFLPQEIIAILQKNNIRAIPTGLKYGTISALINDKTFEITTLRKDIKNNGRHPETEFIDDYYFDAKRRDFTINALYLDDLGNIYDYFNGFEDLKNKKVVFIGNAEERIKEDYLRILRFFRFSCFYCDEIDQKSLLACKNNKDGIDILSPDRIRTELFKFFDKKTIKLTEILSLLEKNVGDKIFNFRLKLDNFEKINNLKLKLPTDLKFFSLIFDKNDNGNNFDEKLKFLSKKLNLNNKQKKILYFINDNYHKNLSTKNELIKFLAFFDKNYVKFLFILKYFDKENIYEIIEFIDNFALPDFILDGQDIINLGFEGSQIGEKLTLAKEIWIEEKFQISKDDLLKKII